LTYAESVLGISGIRIVEGSGISRQNRLPAKTMHLILDEFEPFRHLLPRDGRMLLKTGTLNGITTRAGYIETDHGELLRFVIFLNTPGKSAEPVLATLLEMSE